MVATEVSSRTQLRVRGSETWVVERWPPWFDLLDFLDNKHEWTSSQYKKKELQLEQYLCRIPSTFTQISTITQGPSRIVSIDDRCS